MQCPFCAHDDTKVLESRLSHASVRRRRECDKCSNRFTTYERALFQLTVVKKDGREQPFSLEKIAVSIGKALGKSDDELGSNLTQKVEHKILARKKSPIKTTEIGRIVLSELRKQDKMAYVRFATIHKSIDDPKALEKELEVIS